MATRTTTANGSWTTGATWSGGIAPGASDRVTIGHVVTVDSAATIGASAGSDRTGTGTVGTGGSASTVLTGTGTAFTTQLQAGDLIHVGGSIVGVVASVGSDTALTLVDAVTLPVGTAFTYTPAAIYLSGPSARLTVNASLTVRGAFVHNTPYTVATDAVTVPGPAEIEFDASTAPDPANTHYPWLPLAAHFQLGRVVFHGTSGARCHLRSNTGGGHAYYTTGPFASFGSLRLEGTDVTRIGDATRDAIYIALYAYAVVELVVSDCSFDSGGRYNLAANLAAGTTVQFLRSTWTNTLHPTDSLATFGGTGATDGTSDIRGCVFDRKLSGYATGLTIGGTGPDDWNVFRRGYSVSSAGAWTAFRGNLVASDYGDGLGSAGDVTDCYILADVSIVGNPHFLYGRNEAPSTFTGLIFEYAGTDGSGDCALPGIHKLTVRNSIKLPNAAGLSSGTMATVFNVDADLLDIEHCTFHGGGPNDSSGVRVNILAGAGVITSLRANLYWDTTERGFKLCYSGPGGDTAVNADTVSAAAADYNGGYKFAAGTNGKGYDGGTFSSGAPGAHDLEADPQFVWQTLGLNPTTTPNVLGLGGWDADLGGPGTVAHALAELAKKNDPAGYNPDYNVPALLAWVREMFRPTNPAYVGTTYPGDPATTDAAGNALVGTVGALAYLQPASDYTLTGPGSGLPGAASGAFTVALAYGINPGGTVTITPAVSGFTGTFTPTSVALSNTVREATFTLTPDAAATGTGTVTVTNSGTLADPGPVLYTIAYDPPPGLANWEAAMQWSATGHANAYPPAATANVNTNDHYDPIRVFQSVRDYTGDPGWNTQIAAAVLRYRDQSARPAGGNANAVFAWTNGLVRHYYDTGEVASRETGILIRKFAVSTDDTAPLALSLLWTGSRELAFTILNHLGGEDLGHAPTATIHDMVGNAMGHIDQWTWGDPGSPYTAIGPRSPFLYTQCFMVGITCEALIAYHDRYGDSHVAGIPAKVQQALDWLWDHAYLPAGWAGQPGQAFPYVAGTPNANLLTTTTGTVTAVTSATSWSGDSGLSPLDYVYAGNGVYPGLITFTSGTHAGQTVVLAFYTGYTGATRTFTISVDYATGLPPTWVPAIGDTFTIKHHKFDVGTVASATDSTHITAAPGLNANSGHYVFAMLTYVTGNLAGHRTSGVLAYDAPSRALTLYDPVGSYFNGVAPTAGSTFFLSGSYGPEGQDYPDAPPVDILNGPIEPAYAWYYQWTARQGARDATYRTRHDLLFEGSYPVHAPGGDMGTQKQYNEAYRWSPQGLLWRDYGDAAWPAATHLRLAAPTVASGRANAWSGPFRLHISNAGDTGARVGLGSADRVTVVLSDGGAGGTFAPAGPVLTTTRPWATVRYRAPAGLANGTVISISATATGLTAPAAVSYTIAGGSAPTATGYLFSGPATGPAGSPSSPFTLALVPPSSVPDSTIDAIGGVWAIGLTDYARYLLVGQSPSYPGVLNVPLSGDNASVSLTYTAPAPGTYTLQTYASPRPVSDPQELTYTASDVPPPPPPPTGGRLRLRTAAGVLRLRVGS